ncbi:hypothetical protein C8R46DRAFT_882437 [Mycena filopes]|nr:hypothetical protein C8R46DRAFT_882437 [Mycena filopes]
MANPGSSLVSGIQDISAFLPIIGTDQCERHLGEALTGGFLYAAATPMSLFGCLGIVKASVSILCASVSPRLAQMLEDAGVALQGSTAAMIGMNLPTMKDGIHTFQPTDGFLAGEKFLGLLSTQHIDHAQVSLQFNYSRWNCWLALSTLLLSGLGLLPYISIITNSGPHASSLPDWVYPLMRVIGSALSVVLVQLIIQIRIQEIVGLSRYITLL